jgi:hypothetical protein
LDRTGIEVLAGSVAVMVVGFWLGLLLIRGRRRVGLFLRKFGLQDSTRTVTFALVRSIGRSLRLVTLDDEMVAPLGVGRSRRRVAWWTWLLGLLVVGGGLYWFFGGGFDSAANDVTDSAFANVGGDTPGQAIGSIIGAAVAAMILLICLMLAVIIPFTIAVVVMALGGGSYLAARQAERAAVRRVTGEREIEPTVRSVAKRSRRIFGARLVVLSVVDRYWQQAVHALAGVSDVIIIDVSQPTENLVWEVTRIHHDHPGRWVLVGAQSHLTALTDPRRHQPGSAPDQLARLLDGEQVIAYGSTPPELRRFTRALRGQLDRIRPRARSARGA